MRRKNNLMCKCGHYQCYHTELKKLPNGKKTRMGCATPDCKCLKFIDDRSPLDKF